MQVEEAEEEKQSIEAKAHICNTMQERCPQTSSLLEKNRCHQLKSSKGKPRRLENDEAIGLPTGQSIHQANDPNWNQLKISKGKPMRLEND